jgi:uncharacterized protein (TIGR00730 family)
MSTVCVFGGARSGHDPGFATAAGALGRVLAERGDTLVYGGGRTGMMGCLADAAIAGGAHVIGIIPAFLDHPDIVHETLGEKIVVGDLFERKARMMELADVFVAIPGGLGTLDELLEVVTWRQLRQTHVPAGLFDVDGFFTPFYHALETIAEAGFANMTDIRALHRHGDPAALLDALAADRR